VRKERQLHLDQTRHGGYRPGAGRPRGNRVSHLARPRVTRHTPVHVTLRLKPGFRKLRKKALYRVIRACLRKVNPELGMQVVHHSVQDTHMHFLVEADDQEALARGMQGLSIRLAKGLNRELGRKGKVFGDRYHAEVLRTPRQTRNGLCYVLNNERHHRHVNFQDPPPRGRVDEYSSAAWFDGWSKRIRRPKGCTGPPPHPPPRSWLLRTGWRKHHRPIDPDEVPGPSAYSRKELVNGELPPMLMRF